MPRPMRTNEKSKDFIGSMKRLFKSLNKWRYLLIVALLLAGISAVLSIISPNILSDLTDQITTGIKPNTDNLTILNEKIFSNFNEDKIKNAISKIPESEINSISSINKITDEQQKLLLFINLPDNVLEIFLEDITIDKTTISIDDQIKYLHVLPSLKENTSNFSNIPASIEELIKPKMDILKIKTIAITLGVIYLISALFSYIESFLMATISNNFSRKLRSDITGKINKLPLKFFDNHETGDVLSIVTNDVDTIGMNMNNSLATLVTSLTLFFGSLIMMFITEWRMAASAILASIIGFVFMALLLSKSQKYFNMRQKKLGEMNGFIEEIYSGHNVVRVYNGTKKAKKDFAEINNELYHSNRLSSFISGIMMPLMGFIGNLGYVAVCVVGALLVINNQISFGVIVAFMIYVRLFTNPLSQLAQAFSSLQSVAAASERVFEFVDEEEMSDEKSKKTMLDKDKVLGNIEFKHVKFGYNEDKTIIKDFSVNVKSGEKIAIVGPTGAGKTTMVNLLMKFYEINDGDILIDGVSIKDLTRENIHDLFIMVLQDTWLFEDTIRENIKFNKENVTDEEIWHALKVVGIDHFVKTLPGGLDYKVGDNDTISQGQKQLLTIARGMIENAPFLILDEATSNVDTRTEELVSSAMDKLIKGRTSFIIAHRLSTIKNADIILVMNEGNIIEVGNHQELMAKNGFYAELYNSQFNN